jgi:hypothetical protein
LQDTEEGYIMQDTISSKWSGQTIKDTERRIQDSRYRMGMIYIYGVQVTLCRIEDKKYSEEYRQQDTKCRKRIRNTWYGIHTQHTRYKTQGTGYKIQNTGYRIQSTGHSVHGTWFRSGNRVPGYMILGEEHLIMKDKWYRIQGKGYNKEDIRYRVQYTWYWNRIQGASLKIQDTRNMKKGEG